MTQPTHVCSKCGPIYQSDVNVIECDQTIQCRKCLGVVDYGIDIMLIEGDTSILNCDQDC